MYSITASSSGVNSATATSSLPSASFIKLSHFLYKLVFLLPTFFRIVFFTELVAGTVMTFFTFVSLIIEAIFFSALSITIATDLLYN